MSNSILKQILHPTRKHKWLET